MSYRKVVYYASWSRYRKNEMRFTPQDINPLLCTHAIYAFLGVNADGTLRVRDSKGDIDRKGFRQFVELKKRNKQLRTMIAIGGWNEGSTTFSGIAADGKLRVKFASNVLQFLQEHEFDGVDIDWEYPAHRGGIPEDKNNINLLLAQLRETLNNARVITQEKYLISMAVPAIPHKVEKAYADVEKMCGYVDFLNVMTYNYYTPTGGVVGLCAPLYGAPSDPANRLDYNIDSSINNWLSKGAPREKLTLGVKFAGHSYTLHGSGEKATIGAPGPLLQKAGVLTYSEVAYLKRHESTWEAVWHREGRVPHFEYKGNQWASYENEASVSEKMSYVKEKCLGGAMVWAIDNDDFHNGFPLLTTIDVMLAASYAE